MDRWSDRYIYIYTERLDLSLNLSNLKKNYILEGLNAEVFLVFVFIFLKKRFVFGAVKLSMSSLCGVITVLGRRTATVIMHYQNSSCC